MKQEWDGDEYQARFDRMAASGQDLHGEARFVLAFEPASVLDAGCGTGRVGIELARRGCNVVGVDVDESMLDTARDRAPEVEWVAADLREFDLGRRFDVVVMAGNVPLFTPADTQDELVAGVAAHVAPGGVLIAGFSTDWSDRPYDTVTYDEHAKAAGLRLVSRFATWDRDPWTPASNYAVSVSAPMGEPAADAAAPATSM